MSRLIVPFGKTSFFSKFFLFAFVAGIFLFGSMVQAQVPEYHPSTTGSVMRFPMEQNMWSTPTHTEGILGRAFPNLHGNDALHFDYVYTGAVFNNARGGTRTKGATAYNGLFEIGITADTEKLGLWKNGTFYMHSLFSHGKNPSDYIGDYQEVSVIAYETPAQVSEYWYQHSFFDGFMDVKIGKQDGAADFFFLESTSDFMNASATCVPTTGIPTAPDNAWGVATYINLTENFCFKMGFYDANGNANKFWMSETGDVYSAFQIDYHYSLFKHLPGMAYIGGWYNGAEHESHRHGRFVYGTHGYSIGFEQMIYRQHICDKNDLRGLTMFFQFSDSEEDQNELKGYWGLGFRWLGLFEDRPDDVFGFAINTARFSRGYKESEELRHGQEVAYELHYKMQLTDNVAVQPVFQYVVHPGGQFKNAFVPGLMFQMIF